jgi:hypothetical protein
MGPHGGLRLRAGRPAITVDPFPDEGTGMSQAHQQTLANVTAIIFGLCSLIAAGVIFAAQF